MKGRIEINGIKTEKGSILQCGSNSSLNSMFVIPAHLFIKLYSSILLLQQCTTIAASLFM